MEGVEARRIGMSNASGRRRCPSCLRRRRSYIRVTSGAVCIMLLFCPLTLSGLDFCELPSLAVPSTSLSHRRKHMPRPMKFHVIAWPSRLGIRAAADPTYVRELASTCGPPSSNLLTSNGRFERGNSSHWPRMLLSVPRDRGPTSLGVTEFLMMASMFLQVDGHVDALPVMNFEISAPRYAWLRRRNPSDWVSTFGARSRSQQLAATLPSPHRSAIVSREVKGWKARLIMAGEGVNFSSGLPVRREPARSLPSVLVGRRCAIGGGGAFRRQGRRDRHSAGAAEPGAVSGDLTRGY